MASAADVRFAQMMSGQYKQLGDSVRRQQSSLQNRRNKMGFGRILGAVGGGLLGLATGGGALIAAAGAGLGSRLGSEWGQRSTKVDEVQQGSLFREKAAQARSEGIEAQRQLNRGANVSALSDAFSAYTLAGTAAGQKAGTKLSELFRGEDWAIKQAMAAPGAGGFSIDQLNEGVRQKYGQKMIQRKPGEEYARSILGPNLNTTGQNISDKVTIPQDVVENVVIEPLTPQQEVNRNKIAEAFNTNNTGVGGLYNTGMSPQVKAEILAANPQLNQNLAPGPNNLNTLLQTPPTPGTQAINFDNTMVPSTASMQSPVGPYAPYTGTMEQNLQLAEVLNLNTNRSIVDQLKAYGADSSMEARRRMFEDYFGGAY